MKIARRGIIADLFLIECHSSRPEVKWYGFPDRINAIVFYDADRNRVLDSGAAVTKERE